MGIKEQVKKGLLSAVDAQAKVAPDSHTFRWCQRRIMKPVASKESDAGHIKPKGKYSGARSKYTQKKKVPSKAIPA